MNLQSLAISALAGLLIGFGGGWKVASWRCDAREKAAVEAAHQAERNAQQNVIDTLQRQITGAQEASRGFQQEIDRLRLPRPIGPVRLCQPTRSAAAHLPAPSTAPGGPVTTPAPGELVPAAPSRDIGPDLDALAQEGDRCSAQLRALLGWVEKTREIHP